MENKNQNLVEVYKSSGIHSTPAWKKVVGVSLAIFIASLLLVTLVFGQEDSMSRKVAEIAEQKKIEALGRAMEDAGRIQKENAAAQNVKLNAELQDLAHGKENVKSNLK